MLLSGKKLNEIIGFKHFSEEENFSLHAAVDQLMKRSEEDTFEEATWIFEELFATDKVKALRWAVYCAEKALDFYLNEEEQKRSEEAYRQWKIAIQEWWKVHGEKVREESETFQRKDRKNHEKKILSPYGKALKKFGEMTKNFELNNAYRIETAKISRALLLAVKEWISAQTLENKKKMLAAAVEFLREVDSTFSRKLTEQEEDVIGCITSLAEAALEDGVEDYDGSINQWAFYATNAAQYLSNIFQDNRGTLLEILNYACNLAD